MVLRKCRTRIYWDKLSGRNINVYFTNNSNVPIEVMVFIFYSIEISMMLKQVL